MMTRAQDEISMGYGDHEGQFEAMRKELEAYHWAMHEMVGAMANLQAWVRMAKAGDVDLMEPDVLDNMYDSLFGKAAPAADPREGYRAKQKAKENDHQG